MEKDPQLEERLDNLYLQVESVCITSVKKHQEITDGEVDFSFLNQYKNLKSVNLHRMVLDNIDALNLIQNLENLSLKRVRFTDSNISFKFPKLKSLSFEEM